MWTCPKCGESIEDQFDSCWNCAAHPKAGAAPASNPRPWKHAILFGALFECLLLFGFFTLPKESWLGIEVHNFCLYSHYPLIALLESFDLLAVILIPLLMALVWAGVFRVVSRLLSGLTQHVGISPRQKMIFAGSLGCLGLAAVVLAVADSGGGKPRPFSPSPELKSVVESHTAFALDLYRQFGAQPGNVFFSPHSTATALSLTQAGARGQTEREIAGALHLAPGQTNQHVAAAELAKRLAELPRGRRIVLNAANSLWCQRGDPFTGTFLDAAHVYYQATVKQVDFARDGEAARRDINRWIARCTDDRIHDLAGAGQFTPDTSLVLCNAMYFKGRWASPFKRSATKDAQFFLTKDRSVSVPMMNKKADFKIEYLMSEGVGAEMLELPYFGKDLSMIVLLPATVDGLAELETNLTPDNLRRWMMELDRAAPHETIVRLPRFKTSQSLDLAPPFKALGITAAFDRKGANFSGIDGVNNLYISAAWHSAFVEVNEEGTEATAVTLFAAKSKSMSNLFKADHPFVFLIRENSTGDILFLGRVVDPTK